MEYNTLLVLLGTGLLGAASGLVGSFALLRGRALLGDVLAHAALPGIVLGYWFRGQRDLSAMLLGAFLSGISALLALQFLRRFTRLKEDALLAMVLSGFFAVGIVLLDPVQRRGDAGLAGFVFRKTAGMLWEDVVGIAAALLLCSSIVLLLYKELLLLTFDPGFGTVQGWPVQRLDFLLLGLIAVVVTAGLPAVGVLLMAAFLVLPAATARFWSQSLHWLIFLAMMIGFLMGCTGTWVSQTAQRLPPAPLIVLFGAGAFFLSALASPRKGWIGRWYRERETNRKMQQLSILRHLYQNNGILPVDQVSASLRRSLVQSGLILIRGAELHWTPQGEEQAILAMREHRLWQLFFESQPELAREALVFPANPITEVIEPAQRQQWEQALEAQHRWPTQRSLA